MAFPDGICRLHYNADTTLMRYFKISKTPREAIMSEFAVKIA
jgi:hypothetical protein